jgi:hypothetical protein
MERPLGAGEGKVTISQAQARGLAYHFLSPIMPVEEAVSWLCGHFPHISSGDLQMILHAHSEDETLRAWRIADVRAISN